MNPRSKSVWITPAACGAVQPLWMVQARDSLGPAVRNVCRPRVWNPTRASWSRPASSWPESASISAAGPRIEDRAALREDLVGLLRGVQDRGVGLLAADLLLQPRDGALEGLQVREHQLGVDGVDVVGRVDAAGDVH